MSRFLSADDEAVRCGRVNDVYFERCAAVLRREGVNPMVAMEVSASSLLEGRAVFCDTYDDETSEAVRAAETGAGVISAPSWRRSAGSSISGVTGTWRSS